MNRAEYLIARGWKCVIERWLDPHCVNSDGSIVSTTSPGAYLDEESAERRQLDRDAAARDYLEARRPGIIQVVMALIMQPRTEENGWTSPVLLGKRSEGYEFPGHWCLPGGKVEAGESLEDALFRELREEVGASFETTDIDFGPVVWDFDPPVVKKRVRIYCYDLTHREGLTYAPLDGLDAVQWFAPVHLGELTMTPATREALRWKASPPLHVGVRCEKAGGL